MFVQRSKKNLMSYSALSISNSTCVKVSMNEYLVSTSKFKSIATANLLIRLDKVSCVLVGMVIVCSMFSPISIYHIKVCSWHSPTPLPPLERIRCYISI